MMLMLMSDDYYYHYYCYFMTYYYYSYVEPDHCDLDLIIAIVVITPILVMR